MRTSRVSLTSKAIVSVLGALGAGAAGSVTNNHLSQLNAAPIAPSTTPTWTASAFTSRTGAVRVQAQMTVSKNGGTMAAGNVISYSLLRNGSAIGGTARVTAATSGSDVTAFANLAWIDNAPVDGAIYAIEAVINAGSSTAGVIASEASITVMDV